MTPLFLSLVLSSAPLEPAAVSIEDFCPKGYQVLKGDACLLAPDSFTPGKLIVYFHGMLAPGLKSPLELSILGRLAKARGFAVLAPRGQAGGCPWGGFESWWCWPSDKSQVSQVGGVIERLSPLFKQTARALKVRSLGAPNVAGFSNGGYFSTLLLSETYLDAKGCASLHAGGVTGQEFDDMRRSPVLLVMAKEDQYQLPGMRALSSTLRTRGWPVAERERQGGHEVREEDVAAMLDFFESLGR